jgi:hypothetical protein
MYIVRMKRVTASQARREWFRILDEVVAGEVVIVDRKGLSIQIRRLDPASDAHAVPDYSGILAVHERPEDADRWGWEWTEDGEDGLRPVDREDP